MTTRIDGVFFDLDGTLVNTLEDLGGSMNAALEEAGLPVHPPAAYRNFIGHGMESLVVRASGGKGDVDVLLGSFLRHYQDRMVRATRPYPGVWEMLSGLRERNVPVAVVSNKSHGMTVSIVQRIFAEVPFLEVRGHRKPTPKKPDPDVLWDVLRQLGIGPQRCLYVGDSDVDIRAAHNAGMISVGVSWGYHGEARLKAEGASIVLNEPLELLRYVEPGGEAHGT